MAKAIDKFADTTAVTGMNDVVDDALTSLHISGSVLLREAYSPPWAITVPGADKLAALLDVKAGARVVAFHLVEFGHCAIEPEGGENVLLKAGEMAVCFGGEAHRISQGKAPRAQPLETLLAGGKNAQRPPATGLASGTSLLCGVFLLHHTAFNPLFTALPRLMHTTLSRSGALHNLSGVARLMAEEIDRKSLGGRYVVERLLEVLCAEAVRAHIETAPYQNASWFQGIKDPVVGRAIAAIHEHPGKGWSVQRLARVVAMSPSRFAARFAESLGDSPMAYITKWRINVACRQLVTSQQGIDQIAASVGYESSAAFNRAFKKHVGLPPAAWRTRERA
jgi:AraC-like DNA-binding protein